jgi:DNA repair protein RadC
MAKMRPWEQFEVRTVRVRAKKGRPQHGGLPTVTGPADVRVLFADTVDTLTQECMWGIYVDGRNQVLGIQELYRGTSTGTSVRTAEIVAPALRLEASGVVVVHNHPSGNPEASKEDLELTSELRKACDLMDIAFLDHIVLGKDDNLVSIRRDYGNLWSESEDDADLFSATPDDLKELMSLMSTSRMQNQ